MKSIHIIGGGASGCSLALFLSKKYKVSLYEKTSSLGGLAKTLYNMEGIPYSHGLNLLKNPPSWILDLFPEIKKVEMNFGINPFLDFSTYDYPLSFKSIESISWHWLEAIKLEIENITEDYSEEMLSEFLIKNYGSTLYYQMYEPMISKMYNSSNILLEKDFKKEYPSLFSVEENNYYYPVDRGWDSLFKKMTENSNITLNREVEIKDFSRDDIVICTIRPDKFFYNKETLIYRKSIVDVDSTFSDNSIYDHVLYPKFVPFFSMFKFNKLFTDSYEGKSIMCKEYIGDEGLISYVSSTRENIEKYKEIISNYPKIIYAGLQGSYRNLSIVDCIVQSHQIASKLNMES